MKVHMPMKLIYMKSTAAGNDVDSLGYETCNEHQIGSFTGDVSV